MRRSRYEKQDAPDIRFLKLYLRDANPTSVEQGKEPPGRGRPDEWRMLREWWNMLGCPESEPDPVETEKRRVNGVAQLVALARAGHRNPDLRRFFEINGYRILISNNQEAALREFLGQGPRKRGAPVQDLDHRNLTIAADVAQLCAGGLSREEAIKEVSQRPGAPGIKMVEEIYDALKDDDAILAVIEIAQSRTKC